jgi:integrase
VLMRRATGQLCENRSSVTGEVTSWGARFRYQGQRRYLTLEAESREEAVREMALLMFRVRRGIWEPPRKHRRHAPGPRPPKLADFAEDWLAGEKVQGGRRGTGLAPARYASLQWRLGHLLRFFASARLDEITVMDVDRYRQTKLGEGTLSAESINKTVLTLGAIFELAIEYGLVGQNPTHGRRRRLPVSKPRRAWLDRADHIIALLDAAGELDREAQPRRGYRRALIATLVFAGLRISEALALRWGEIDLTRGTLRVDQAKTDAGVRTINLLPVLRDELREHKARGEYTTNQLVFATSTGRAVTATNVRKRILQPAIARASKTLEQRDENPLPEGITPTRAAPYVRLAAVRDRGVTALRHQPARARHPSPHPRNLRPPDEPTRRRARPPTSPDRRPPRTRRSTDPYVPMTSNPRVVDQAPPARRPL